VYIGVSCAAGCFLNGPVIWLLSDALSPVICKRHGQQSVALQSALQTYYSDIFVVVIS